MKKVLAEIPITGRLVVEIEVPDDATEDDMFEAATEKYATSPDETDLEWEFHWCVTEGNVFHGLLNEASFEVVRRD
jgi:hypothetical protein